MPRTYTHQELLSATQAQIDAMPEAERKEFALQYCRLTDPKWPGYLDTPYDLDREEAIQNQEDLEIQHSRQASGSTRL